MPTEKTSAERELVALAVSGITFLSPREKSVMYEAVNSVDEFALLEIKDISGIIGRTVKSRSWDGKSLPASARRSRAIMHTFDIQYTTVLSDDYPSALSNIPDKPFAIFYRGNLDILKNQCVGIVGSRLLTPEGKRDAATFAKAAAEAGLTVVSGLASGADSAAHIGALQTESGRTAAVLPSGIDTIVPASNKAIAAAVVKRGCLLSEYPPGTPPLNWRFVQRNRIIAGLSEDILVVQAPHASGALITADFAEEYDRNLYVLKSAFCQKALTAAMLKKQKLQAEKGKKKRKSICDYVANDGVPVVEDFADFVKCKSEAPGTRFFDVSEFSGFFEI